MNKPRNLRKPDESNFLGILVGRKKRAEADAEAKKTQAAIDLEEAKRLTFLAQAQAAQNGYDPEAAAADQAIKLEETKQQSDKTLYVIVGFVVLIVMVALYFIKKR